MRDQCGRTIAQQRFSSVFNVNFVELAAVGASLLHNIDKETNTVEAWFEVIGVFYPINALNESYHYELFSNSKDFLCAIKSDSIFLVPDIKTKQKSEKIYEHLETLHEFVEISFILAKIFKQKWKHTLNIQINLQKIYSFQYLRIKIYSRP